MAPAYVGTMSMVNPRAEVCVHASTCRNAHRRPGVRAAWKIEATTLDAAIEETRPQAEEVGRKLTVCRCAKVTA